MHNKERAIDLVYTAMRGKNVLVLGSSPNLKLPDSYNKEWCLVTINASVAVANGHGLGIPDLSIFAASVLLRNDDKFVEVRKYLTGLKSESVIIRTLGGGFIKNMMKIMKAKAVLKKINYKSRNVAVLPPSSWQSIVCEVMGDENVEMAKNISTGVFCVLLAIYSGASYVVVSGIDPGTDGHSYSSINRGREHKSADARVLAFVGKMYDIKILIN